MSLIFITAGLLISSYSKLSNLYRRQLQILIAATVVPFVIGYTLGWLVWQRIDVAQVNLYAVGAVVGNWLIAYAVFSLRLPEWTPTLWGIAQHIPSDLAIAVNAQGQIVETNATARERLGLTVGQPIPDVLVSDQAEVEIGNQIYQQRKQPILAEEPGELVVLHDITERVRAEQALKQTNQELERLRSELRDQAYRDALTGLFNRRYLDQRFPVELERSRSEGVDMSLVLFDIDYFRDINSRFGYAGGDAVLRGVGSLLLRCLPQPGFACRVGGEEFCVILPQTSLEQAEEFARELQHSLRSERFEVDGKKVAVAISAACASLLENKGQNLLRAVDETLRQAKQTGRNKVLRAKPWLANWGTGWV